MKKSKGITLIALVITIIILIILAGVAINLGIGDNGIFNKAKLAKEKYNEESIREKVELGIMELEIEELALENQVTIESVLQELLEKETFETIDKDMAIGNIGEHEVKLKYNEQGKIVIEYIAKATGVRVTYKLNPESYTNGEKVGILLTVNGKVKSVTKPDNLIIYPENNTVAINYQVTANGTYKFIIEDEEGNKQEKNVIVDTIDRLPPNDFTITAENIEGGIKIIANTTDAESDGVSVKSGIDRYEYFLRSVNETEYTKYNTNEIEIIDNTAYWAYVIAYDKAGNSKTSNVINVGEESGDLVWVNNSNLNRTMNGETSTYQNPIIPVGFCAIDTPDAKWNKLPGNQTDWNKGLVIKNITDENEFVWVPVDKQTVKYEKWCTSGEAHTKCTDKASTSGLDVADNVNDYGGFWVARYEAGVPATMNQNLANETTRNVRGIPLSVEGAIPWNYISWNNAKLNAESMYANEYVQSGLINGTQWDTIMRWIDSEEFNVLDSSSWGNHLDSVVTLKSTMSYISSDYCSTWNEANNTIENQSHYIKTGSSDETKAKNIYDLAGNLAEWTNEDVNGYGVTRGGWAYQNALTAPASWRYAMVSGSNHTPHNLSFRVQLYVK